MNPQQKASKEEKKLLRKKEKAAIKKNMKIVTKPLSQADRMKMIEILEKIVFPMFPDQNEYWPKLFAKRNGPGGIFEEDKLPFADMFKLGSRMLQGPDVKSLQVKDSVTGQPTVKVPVEIVMICTVPDPIFFWDAVLSAYHLYAPEIYPSASSMVRHIYRCIEIQQINPITHYTNITNYHWAYLDDLRDCRRGLQLIAGGTSTLFWLIQMKTAHFAWTNLGESMFKFPETLTNPKFQAALSEALHIMVNEAVKILGLDDNEITGSINNLITTFQKNGDEAGKAAFRDVTALPTDGVSDTEKPTPISLGSEAAEPELPGPGVTDL